MTTSYPTQPESGRHQVNIGHLVMGIALLGLVGVWALWQTEVVSDQDVHWLLPIPWVAAGLGGLVTTAITGPRRHAVRHAGWAGEPSEPQRPEPAQEQAQEQADAVEETAPLFTQRAENPADEEKKP